MNTVLNNDATRLEMPIPKSFGEVSFHFVITTILVSFAFLALVNLCLWVAVIPSLIWLAFVTLCVRSSAKRDGGLRSFIMNQMGDLFGSKFVERDASGPEHQCIRFGFRLFGRPFIQKRVPVQKIESVAWRTGQASGMAGRDVGDWKVWMYFDRGDQKSDHIFYGIGPAVRKERTETLGLAFVSFLQRAGVNLVQEGQTNCFVRRG